MREKKNLLVVLAGLDRAPGSVCVCVCMRAGAACVRGFCSSGSDPHAVLGLRRGASKAEIKAAFRRAALKHHPDRNLSNRFEAEVAFKRASDAHAALLGDDQASCSGGAGGSSAEGGFRRGCGMDSGGFAREQWEREHRQAFEEMLRSIRGGERSDAGGAPRAGSGFAQGVQVKRTIVPQADGSASVRTEITTKDSRGRRSARVRLEPLDGRFPAHQPHEVGFLWRLAASVLRRVRVWV